MLTPKPTTGDTTWFVHDQFGRFIQSSTCISLPGFGGRVEFARFLHDGSEVPLTGNEWETRQLTVKPDEQLLILPVKKLDVTVPVIELTLK